MCVSATPGAQAIPAGRPSPVDGDDGGEHDAVGEQYCYDVPAAWPWRSRGCVDSVLAVCHWYSSNGNVDRAIPGLCGVMK